MRKLDSKFVVIGFEFANDIPDIRILIKIIDLIKTIFQGREYKIFNCEEFKNNNALYASVWQYCKKYTTIQIEYGKTYYLIFFNIKMIDILFNKACILKSFQEVEFKKDFEHNRFYNIENEKIINKKYYFFDDKIFQLYQNSNYKFNYLINELFVFYNEIAAEYWSNSKSSVYKNMLHKLPFAVQSKQVYLIDYHKYQEILPNFFNNLFNKKNYNLDLITG